MGGVPPRGPPAAAVTAPGTTPGSTPDGRLDRSRFVLAFADDFSGPELNADRWVDHYLPHWTTPERSQARYAFTADGLQLRVEADQPAWRPEDGELRVSNIQTGSFSGAYGSGIGQHRHLGDLTVRTPQPNRRLWTPSTGLVEATVRASADPTCMLAIWLVGFEEQSPQQSGEICIAELFGNVIGSPPSLVRSGVKAHHDPALTSEVTDISLDIDATDWHTYAAAWDAQQVTLFVDDRWVAGWNQGLDYPLQLMVDLFEFPQSSDDRDPGSYPKTADVRSVRGYSWR